MTLVIIARMERAVSKLRKEFPNKIISGINTCLKVHNSLSATILICCAIDLLSKYYSGETRSSKNKYIDFLSKYFPQYSDHESFYTFVRCGLIHSYNLDRKYILIHSDANWAHQLHMKLSPKHKMVIINPYMLRKDLLNALDMLIKDLTHDKQLRRRFRKIYRRYPLEGQSMKIAKFKYLVANTSL